MVQLKIEVGRYYRDSDGEVFEISHEDENGLFITTCDNSYYDNGWNEGNEIDGAELITEISKETYFSRMKSKKFKEVDYQDEIVNQLIHNGKIKNRR